MYQYKCDKCGCPINVDPGEPRICNECLARMEQAEKHPARIVYGAADKREVSYAG